MLINLGPCHEMPMIREGAENSQSLTAGTNAQSLAEAAELGITITRCRCSVFFSKVHL